MIEEIYKQYIFIVFFYFWVYGFIVQCNVLVSVRVVLTLVLKKKLTNRMYRYLWDNSDIINSDSTFYIECIQYNNNKRVVCIKC